MTTKHYRIHDILTFRVVDYSQSNAMFKDWDIELRGFETDYADKYDFTVEVGEFTPDNSNCTILDDDYFIRENYIYCRRDACTYARWRVELSGLESEHFTVRIESNMPGKALVPELVINPVIWYKLNEKGYPVIHGAAASRDGQAYIFAGRGGAGKTTISLDLVERGFKLLSEHFVLLHDSNALSLPTPLHIMDYNLVPLLRSRMQGKLKSSFHLRQLFHRLTGKRIATKVLPQEILSSSLVETARLQAVFLLLPGGEFKAEKMEKKEVVDCLVSNQKLEMMPFIRYMMEYAYLFPESKMANFWTCYAENISLALGSPLIYRVEVPPMYSTDTIEKVLRLLSECENNAELTIFQ